MVTDAVDGRDRVTDVIEERRRKRQVGRHAGDWHGSRTAWSREADRERA